jgi:hypothetical protein
MTNLMYLHSIIECNEDHEKSLLWERIAPYKKMLYTYYKLYFGCEPMLMVTDVFNAAQYVKIVPEDELYEAARAYYNEEDFDDWYENVCFNSLPLKNTLL